MSTPKERQAEMEHALAFFKKYVKPRKELTITTVRRTSKNYYLRVFIVSTGYSMGQTKPRIQDITYSVGKLLGLPLIPYLGYMTVARPTGLEPAHRQLTGWLNKAIFGDDTSKYYEGNDL